MKKVYFTIGDLFHSFFINITLIKLQQSHPEYFVKNYVINEVLGSFPYSIWSTSLENKYTNINNMKKIIEQYSKNNITINYLFDIENITNKMLNDTFSNIMLELANKKGNKITLKSELLGDYISTNFPNYEIVYLEKKIDNKKILCDNFYLKTIDKLEKEKIILILTPYCNRDCVYYNIHHEYVENEKLNFIGKTKHFPCVLPKHIFITELEKHINFISNKSIKNYINCGYFHFLINIPDILRETYVDYSYIDTIELYLYYLIKPEYHSITRNLLYENLVKLESKFNEKI